MNEKDFKKRVIDASKEAFQKIIFYDWRLCAFDFEFSYVFVPCSKWTQEKENLLYQIELQFGPMGINFAFGKPNDLKCYVKATPTMGKSIVATSIHRNADMGNLETELLEIGASLFTQE